MRAHVKGNSTVLVTDSGRDGVRAAALMGAIKRVDPTLEIYPTHLWIASGDIRAAGGTLHGMLPFWPAGTVFLCSVARADDAGLRWLAVSMENGCVAIVPDNGLLTMTYHALPIREIRVVQGACDELACAEAAGKLAAGTVAFETLGELVNNPRLLAWTEPTVAPGRAEGCAALIMQTFGNVVTNLRVEDFERTGIQNGDTVQLSVHHRADCLFRGDALVHRSFGYAADGAPIVFNGSDGFVAFGLNRRNFVKTHLPRQEAFPEELSAYRVVIEKKEQEQSI